MKKIKNVLIILTLPMLTFNVQANPNIEKILNNKEFVFEQLDNAPEFGTDLYQKNGKLFYKDENSLCEIKKPNKNNKIFEKENQNLSLALKEEFDKIQKNQHLFNNDNIFDETIGFIKIFKDINKNIFCNSIPYTIEQIKEQKEMFFNVVKIRNWVRQDFLEKNKDVVIKDPMERKKLEIKIRGAKVKISASLSTEKIINKHYLVLEQNLKN